MDAEAGASQPAPFSRYRSVRKAVSRDAQQVQAPPLSALPAPPVIPPSYEPQQKQGEISRAPSRYHRAAAKKSHTVPVPVPVQQSPPPSNDAPNVPSRYHKRQGQGSIPPPVAEPIAESVGQSPRSPPQAKEEWPKEFQRAPVIQDQQRAAPRDVPAQPDSAREARYRSKSTSTPQTKPLNRRTSYDAAREEARLILEGEYDRLERLKKQQEILEKERKLKAAAKTAQRVAETQVQDSHQEAQQAPSKRKWTIGGGSNHRTPPTTAITTQSPSSSKKLQRGQEPNPSAAVNEVHRPQDVSPTHGDQPALQPLPEPAATVLPTRMKRERRPTQSKPNEAQVPQTWQPKAGNGPPKSAVNGPQATVDAPVSAVNAGERRVEVRFEKSRITLPITPTTTVKDLLNSASVILSQPIDPRTSVLVETYFPLGLERPLRRYEHIRDVMNSWDSDTQNYLLLLPQSECAATGLEQKEAPTTQPGHLMLQLHHSQRPGKWEKHWMILKQDGQVTASTKENDGNAANVFHLSDFDVYMPSRREIKQLRPPKKICFAVKSQQRSIMFESTENFVHFFSTNDKAQADQWYNAVQAWRSWYLVDMMGLGTTPKLPPSAFPPGKVSLDRRRPSTSHSRDSIPYQLGTFEPLLDFNVDAFAYGENAQSTPQLMQNHQNSPKRSGTLANHARSKSITKNQHVNVDRSLTLKRGAYPSAPRHQAVASQSSSQLPPSSTDAGFTGQGLLARAFSVRKQQAEEAATFQDNTDNAFTGKGLLSRGLSTRRPLVENQNPGVIYDTGDAFTGAGLLSRKLTTKKSTNSPDELNPGFITNTNEAFTGNGMLSTQRQMTRKKSAAEAKASGQPLVDLAANSEFQDGSLLRDVEGYQIATGQIGPIIDRSKGIEVTAKTGEV